jgi:alkanesulfonate monooxygenase SsuD/methylene tetrahydromethanopterin reductase-like flavin-dependent oxidoreductase (luciferase family)
MTSDMRKLMNIWTWCIRRSVHPHVTNITDDEMRLWEGSWEEGAKMFDPIKGAYDPEKIHRIKFNGKHHKTSAFGATHPSPQRTPVLFQAGASKAGKEFAAMHAEAVFVGGQVPSETLAYVRFLE